LLEALKKAERAKEEAQRRAREGDGAEAGEAERKPVVTRDKLPDISPALEIESADLAQPVEPAALELALEAEPAKEAPRARPAPASAASADAQAAARESARKVFEAKFREPNPRLPFFITLGALGVFAVGTVIYFWLQLRPPAPLVNLNPARPAGESQVAAVEAKPAAVESRPAGQSGIPGLPPPSTTAAPAAPRVEAKPPPRETPRIETPRLQPPLQPQRRPDLPATEITATPRTPPQVHPKVGAGYAAYLAGDLGAARTEYQDALREDPANRDALLGLAAVDVRAGRYEAAEAAYRRLLHADPRDAHAQAALVALRAGRSDPVAAESRVKSMLADNPSAHVLNFTLGNQFAQQGRWAEAQQEYFKAFAAEPDNPDFAYNLAVSLDHLRQPRLALEYYQRALALAKARGASFDVVAAEARAAQLGR
jgi:tetratricopeptide (TPR) repeat protein